MIQTDKKLTYSDKPASSNPKQVREVLGRYQIDVEIGGHVDFSRQLTNSLHRHNFFEICFVTSGHGEYLHGEVRYKLSPGDVFVSDPGVLHEISSFGTKDLTLYFLRFSAIPLGTDVATSGSDDPAAKDFGRFMKEHRIHVATDGALRHFVELMDAPSIRSDRMIGPFAAEIVKILTTLPATVGEDQSIGEFDALFAYIDSHPDRKLTCQELADFAGMSERTLRRRFKTVTGTTLGSEVDHRRMRSAAHRLLGGASVREVADSLGDMDPAQFHRSFTRIFGMSPKKFQQSYVPGSWRHGGRP